MDAELRQVANGFDYKVRTFEKYDINGYRFRTIAKEQKMPIKNLQIRVSLLSAKEVSSIMEELKQYTNFYSMVKILRTSLSLDVIGFFHRRLDGLMNM